MGLGQAGELVAGVAGHFCLLGRVVGWIWAPGVSVVGVLCCLRRDGGGANDAFWGLALRGAKPNLAAGEACR